MGNSRRNTESYENIFGWLENFLEVPVFQKKDFSHTLFCVWDPLAGTVSVNQPFARFFPVSGLSWFSLRHIVFPGDFSRIRESLGRPGQTGTLLLRLKTAESGYRYFLIRHSLLQSPGGTGGRQIVLALDLLNIPELRKRVDESIVSTGRIKYALEASQEGLWDWSPQDGKVYYSPRYISMIGYKPENFPRTFSSWTELLHPDDYEKTVSRQLAIASSPRLGNLFDCTYRLRAAAGNYLWIRGRGIVVSRDERGKALRIVGVHTDVSELEEARIQLAEAANHDVLTGLYSRRYFESALSLLEQDSLPVALIYLDVDALKMVNDCLGHTAGDALLRRLARILDACLRQSDILARIGGDEFVVILKKTSPDSAEEVLKKIQIVLAENNFPRRRMPMCVSAGLAVAATCGELESLCRRADTAMLQQKQQQREANHAIILQWINSFAGRRRNDGYLDPRICCPWPTRNALTASR